MNMPTFNEADQYLRVQVKALQTMLVSMCLLPVGSKAWQAQTLQALQTLRTTTPPEHWTDGAEAGLADMEQWLQASFPVPDAHTTGS